MSYETRMILRKFIPHCFTESVIDACFMMADLDVMNVLSVKRA